MAILTVGKLTGTYIMPAGNNTLVAAGYDGATVIGGDGDDTIAAIDGGIFKSFRFEGGAGDDRVTISERNLVENTPLDEGSPFQKGSFVDGGDGVDTFELTTTSPITMPLADSISLNGLGESIILRNVERFVIKGSAWGDLISGSPGDDWLDGRGGWDTFNGSAGNDNYVFDENSFAFGTQHERVVGEKADGGVDTIWSGATVDLRDDAHVENLRLTGKYWIDGTGNELANLITGNSGSNVIAGGRGNDTLWGKGGADTFQFAEAGVANKDTIWDFGADDRIRLDKTVFADLHADGQVSLGLNGQLVWETAGILSDADFVIGAKANAAHAQVIYNKATGVLSYDADGTGSGAAEDIAFIGKTLGFVDHTDILLG